MSAKTTKTAGKKIGFFEQLISNIGVPGMGRGGPVIGSGRASDQRHSYDNIANINIETILMILIIGFIAGPEVSLQGSPTVSPVIEDL